MTLKTLWDRSYVQWYLALGHRQLSSQYAGLERIRLARSKPSSDCLCATTCIDEGGCLGGWHIEVTSTWLDPKLPCRTLQSDEIKTVVHFARLWLMLSICLAHLAQKYFAILSCKSVLALSDWLGISCAQLSSSHTTLVQLDLDLGRPKIFFVLARKFKVLFQNWLVFGVIR